MSGLQGGYERNVLCMVCIMLVEGVKDVIIMDTRGKLLLIRYRFGELIID